MTLVLYISLPRAQICQNFPRAAVYGPKEEGGLRITNIYTYQGCTHLATLIEHIDAKDMTGDLLQSSLEHAMIEVGVGRSLFTLDYNKFEHILTDCWIKHLWLFCHEHSIQLIDLFSPTLALWYDNDI